MKTLPTFPTKKSRLAFFREMLSTKSAWALRTLVVIHSYQTATEQAAGATIEHNGVGFSGVDAEILTSFMDQYATWKKDKAAGTNQFDTPLSVKQMAILFKKAPKYARQLIGVLEGKGTSGIEIVKGAADPNTPVPVADDSDKDGRLFDDTAAA